MKIENKEKEKEKILSRWFDLAEEFENKFKKNKMDLGTILSTLKKFAKEKNLDVWDVEAISKICFGKDAGDFLFSVYLKSIGALKKEII